MTRLLGFLRGLPRPAGYALLAVLAFAAIAAWHGHRVAAAYAGGRRDQATADRGRIAAAATAAAAAQHALATRLAARQVVISKGTDDALATESRDLARRYADLRLRWATARADRGGAGAGGTTALPGAAAGADDPACAARGWVSFDTAAAAAEAADRAIAKDDAWIAWAAAQRVAWPG